MPVVPEYFLNEVASTCRQRTGLEIENLFFFNPFLSCFLSWEYVPVPNAKNIILLVHLHSFSLLRFLITSFVYGLIFRKWFLVAFMVMRKFEQCACVICFSGFLNLGLRRGSEAFEDGRRRQEVHGEISAFPYCVVHFWLIK